jgi:hypothetical protein
LAELRFRGAQLFHLWADKHCLRLPKLDLGAETLPAGFNEQDRAHYLEKSAHQLEKIEDAARRVTNGEIGIFGTASRFGDRLPWKADFIHNVTAPEKYWKDIPFLNAACVGDSKVVWELNRLQFVLPVAKAHFFTGNPAHYKWLAGTLRDWLGSNPYPVGINWASSLELAFRVIVFDWVVRFCREPLLLDHDFRCAVLKSLYIHGRHINRYLSTYFSPNTHLSGEALGLYLLGVRYPFLPNAAEWRETGRRTLLKCLGFHVLPDGGYYERSTWYHRYTMEIFLLFAFLAEEAGDILPPIVLQKLDSLSTFMLHAVRGDGTFPLIGDDDGGRLIALDSLDPGDVRGLMALCAVLLNRGDLKAVSGDRTEAVWWLWGRKGIDAYEALRVSKPEKTGAVFPETGYAFLRGGWEDDSAVVSMDAGPLGAGNCGHAHCDALSLTLSVGGRRIITDPGTCSYTLDPGKRNHFRSIEAHSAPYIEGCPSSIPSGSPFHWRQMEDPSRFSFSSVGWEMDMLAAGTRSHAAAGVPVKLVRKVIFLKPKNLIFIWDFFEGTGDDAGISQFILCGPDWVATPNGANSCLAAGSTVNIQAIGDLPLGIQLDAFEVSPSYLQLEKGFRLRFRRAGRLPAMIATAIHWGVERADMAMDLSSAATVKVQCGAESIWCFVAGDEKMQSGAEFETDASAACVVKRGERIGAAWALNVSKLACFSKPLLNSDQVVERWRLV